MKFSYLVILGIIISFSIGVDYAFAESDTIISVQMNGPSIFYLDEPNQIIRATVEIQNYSPSADGIYFMKVTHIPTQKVMKNSEIYPKPYGNDIWSVQIAYPFLESDITIGDQKLLGEYEIHIRTEKGSQTASTKFSILETATELNKWQISKPEPKYEPEPISSAVTVKAIAGSSVPGCGAGIEPWRSPCFEPYEVTIIVGEEVEWINNDSSNHTVTSGGGGDGPSGLFDSGPFTPSKPFVHKFETEGKFGYYCVLHGGGGGYVIVGSDFSLDDPIPDWLKNMVSNWGNSIYHEPEFLRAIGYLIERDVIQSEKISYDYSGVQAASWIRAVAVWWGEGLITDEEFVNAMQNLIDREIIRL